MCNEQYKTCCLECYKYIFNICSSAALLWKDLCFVNEELCMDDSFLILEEEDSPDIKILEENGFVITTETKNHIILKLKGEEPIFCVKRGLHGKS